MVLILENGASGRISADQLDKNLAETAAKNGFAQEGRLAH
jgi:hypothetical protein